MSIKHPSVQQIMAITQNEINRQSKHWNDILWNMNHMRIRFKHKKQDLDEVSVSSPTPSPLTMNKSSDEEDDSHLKIPEEYVL